MSTKPRKPRSPATPSRALDDAIADVKRIYDEHSHANLEKSEIASVLKVSAMSGPFGGRLFSLKEYGLLDQNGDSYKVSDTFLTLNTNNKDAKFKRAALAAIRRSATFQEILDSYPNKLPSVSSIAHRLETQQKFNPGPAKSAASVLEKSLRFAGVLDSSNNILPVRDAGAAAADEHEHELDNRRSRNGRHEDHREDALGPGTLSVEIPVAEERTVVIRYPHDLSAEEATKVGNVLAAIVG
jgi:hypothetical protein